MGQDTFLLADVGGTNTRLALGTRDGLLSQTTASYRNDDFEGFTEVLHSYQAKHTNQPIHSAAMAVAGQIVGRSARLTNRDWTFDTDHLRGEIGCEQVHFINDMGGLARALPVLSQEQTSTLQIPKTPLPNGQSMVLGLGTGVNVSTLLGEVTLSAEIGHTSATARMHSLIKSGVDGSLDGFDTVEDILSGRGLELLHRRATGLKLNAAEICALSGTQDDALQMCLLYGSLLAELIRELALHYLPRNGIYLSGSVARGVLQTPARRQVLQSLSQNHSMRDTLDDIPISVITDDAAALLGCLEIAKAAA